MKVYPNEAWCPRCHVSHPPGTRRCLHCGGGVMAARPAETPSLAAQREMEMLETPGATADEEPAEVARVARPLRIGLATLWILLAIAGAILRTCTERQ
jgi:hypothetical protein